MRHIDHDPVSFPRPDFMEKVASAAVTGEKTLAQLEQLYDVHPNQITIWRTKLLE